MYIVRLGELELPRVGYEDNPAAQVNGTFPFSAATGTKSTAAVYFEVEPGNYLPTHTDSSEELLLILEGEAEVTVGSEQGRVSAGDAALVPSMVPHSLRNVGDEKVRVIGFFSGNTSMATFEKPLVPLDQPPQEPPFGERTLTIPSPVALEQAPAPMAEARSLVGGGQGRTYPRLGIGPRQKGAVATCPNNGNWTRRKRKPARTGCRVSLLIGSWVGKKGRKT